MTRFEKPGSFRNLGFTLIEVMVVIIIIGVIINFAVISFGDNNPASALKDEARRFSSLLELAAEEAVLRNEIVGVLLEDDSYLFLLLEDERWTPLQETVFRERQIPEDFEFRLIETSKITDKKDDSEEISPNLILFSSGEMTPFEIKITSYLSDDFYRIIGTEVGNLTLDHVSP